jgi:hypothetical protein
MVIAMPNESKSTEVQGISESEHSQTMLDNPQQCCPASQAGLVVEQLAWLTAKPRTSMLRKEALLYCYIYACFNMSGVHCYIVTSTLAPP